MIINKLKAKVKTGVKNVFITDEVFWKNEIDANMLLAKVMVFSAIILIATNVLNYARIYFISWS